MGQPARPKMPPVPRFRPLPGKERDDAVGVAPDRRAPRTAGEGVTGGVIDTLTPSLYPASSVLHPRRNVAEHFVRILLQPPAPRVTMERCQPAPPRAPAACRRKPSQEVPNRVSP